jgi:predicted RNA-binding protein with PUA-like domain
MNYWLLKSEPNTFSINNLSLLPNQKEIWDGVRNYQARNFLKSMEVGDLAFFYHSSCDTPGITGIVKICRANLADPTQFDPGSDYYDPKSTADNPRWITVEIQLVKKFNTLLSLTHLKTIKTLDNWPLLKKGNRLSVLPVTPIQWQTILTQAEIL